MEKLTKVSIVLLSNSFFALKLIHVVMIYGRCTHGCHYTHGRHPKGVGSIGLFLNLSISGFVHGTHED